MPDGKRPKRPLAAPIQRFLCGTAQFAFIPQFAWACLRACQPCVATNQGYVPGTWRDMERASQSRSTKVMSFSLGKLRFAFANAWPMMNIARGEACQRVFASLPRAWHPNLYVVLISEMVQAKDA